MKESKEVLTQRNPFFGVVGPVGVGKSKLTEEFVFDTHSKKFEEPFRENPYLSDFYTKSHKDFSFDSQMFFLANKGLQMQKIRGLLINETVIQDPAIDVDFMIAKAHHKMGWMTDEEYSAYESASDAVVQDLVKPDIYIALIASKETIKKRIIERGREMELTMINECPEYFDFLVYEFNVWLEKAKETKRVIIVNTEKFDLSDPRNKDHVIRDVKSWMGYLLDNKYQMNKTGSDGANLIFPAFLRPSLSSNVLRNGFKTDT